MERTQRIINQKLPENSVYVGPGSKYQNPFKTSSEMDIDESLWRYRQYLIENIKAGTIDLKPLLGKDLCCWCKRDSRFCHADILLEFFEDEY